MNKTKNTKGYSELSQLSTFEDRYNYCRTTNRVGTETFGYDRYLNQLFYKSVEWNRVRDYVITRDNGCDLGVPGHEIRGRIYIHHINPLTLEDVSTNSSSLLDPENLICVSNETHNAIHYGDNTIVRDKEFKERSKNDTCPWKK